MEAELERASNIMPVDQFTDFSIQTRSIFRREATPKLRRYLEPVTMWVAMAQFDRAKEHLQEAYNLWRDYKAQVDLPALESRLDIVDAYRKDVEKAKEAWKKLQQRVSDGKTALDNEEYGEAVASFQDVLEELERVQISPGARFLLGQRDDGTYAGVWGRIRRQFVDSARGLAREQEWNLRQALRRARVSLAGGDPTGAREALDGIRKAVDLLKQVKGRYDRIAETGWPLSSPIWEDVDALDREITDVEEFNKCLADAHSYRVRGELDQAEAEYEEAAAILASSKTKIGLEEVGRIREIVRQQE